MSEIIPAEADATAHNLNARLVDAIHNHEVMKQRAEAAEDEARLQRTQVDQHKEALALADKRIAELEAERDAAVKRNWPDWYDKYAAKCARITELEANQR
jgi:hypothetical protein